MRWLERYLTEDSPSLQHFAEVTASLAKRDPEAEGLAQSDVPPARPCGVVCEDRFPGHSWPKRPRRPSGARRCLGMASFRCGLPSEGFHAVPRFCLAQRTESAIKTRSLYLYRMSAI